MALQILYTDDSLAVAVKESGIPSTPDISGDTSMVDSMQEQFHKTVYPISRLDRAVGGCMLFAFTKETAAGLSSLTDETYQKEYFAVCEGIPDEKEGILEDYLFHDKRKNMTTVVTKDTKKAKYAKLQYEVMESANGFSLCRVRLHTGRTHQIRVQFASRKMPLAGDGKYGSRQRCPIGLFAAHVAFLHPHTGMLITCECMPDRIEPWTFFSYFQNRNGGNMQ